MFSNYYLFERETLSKLSFAPRAGSQECSSGLPCQWEELSYLNHHLAAFQGLQEQEAGIESQSWGLNPGPPVCDAGVLTARPNSPLPATDFSVPHNLLQYTRAASFFCCLPTAF